MCILARRHGEQHAPATRPVTHTIGKLIAAAAIAPSILPAAHIWDMTATGIIAADVLTIRKASGPASELVGPQVRSYLPRHSAQRLSSSAPCIAHQSGSIASALVKFSGAVGRCPRISSLVSGLRPTSRIAESRAGP